MTQARFPVLRLLAVLAAFGLASSQTPAYAQGDPDSFLLGRDANGEPCQAKRSWDNPHISRYDRSYVITCRGAAASRSQGTILVVNTHYGKPNEDNPCGDEQDVEVKDLGKVKARQCYDKDLGIKVVSASFERDGLIYVGDAAFTAAGPMETALRTLTGAAQVTDRYQTNTAAINGVDLPAVTVPDADTSAAAAAPAGGSFDPAITLSNGIALNQQGAFNEASRVLNDGLSRLPPSASDFTRAEFSLEAGLADSNIGQAESAKGHFADAQRLLAGGGGDKTSAYLVRKLSTYEALDSINRRQWPDALQALKAGDIQNAPLMDPAVVNQLNQNTPATNAPASMAVVDRGELSSILLEAERQWASSVALLATGDATNSETALKASVTEVNILQTKVSGDSLLAVKARIQRQFGRLEAFQGKPDDAIASFDCALAILQGGRVTDPSKCVFDPSTGGAAAAALSGPIIAETELERAALLARDPSIGRDSVTGAYSTAVDSLLAASNVGESQPAELQPYFDILVARNAADPSSPAAEDFFRAVQAIGEPAVAQQMAQLQTVVTADPALGAKVRDRSELERRVIQLRYQIATGAATTAADQASLEAQRETAENELDQVNTELANDPHYRLVDDQLVKISDIRAILEPGEYYLKVVQLKQKAYGIVVGRDQTFLYEITQGSDVLTAIATQVRASIRDNSGTLPFFDVRAAYGLFQLISGPAADTLRNARALIVDPSGPLENLPAGVLVTTPDSVRAYMATVATTPNDYSHVDFLASQTDVYYALSPRSLLISRSLPPSTAPKPFIGFGQNAGPPQPTPEQAALIAPFSGCQMTWGDFLSRVSGNKPVSAREIGLAAHELGADGAPEVTGDAFTDTAVEGASNNGDYEQYQVVHFATHGIPETSVGGCDIPPSLITTIAPMDASNRITSDGFLTFSEIAQLRFDANLVVLSACDTAAGVSGELGRLSGQEDSGKTLDGLVRAFITARARAVMATYWNVPASSETDELMGRFYNFGRGLSMGRALRAAQDLLIRQPQYSHPYYWGAYVLIGDGSKRMLTPAPAAMASN